MKVLVFTSLYPNNVWPNHGIFIKERMTQFAQLEGCEVKVVAPVPYFPAINVNWRWSFSQVLYREIRDGVEVYHPRYYMLPKFGMALHGLLMFLCSLATIRRVQKTFDFDLIDAHFVYPDGFAAILLGRFFRKPVVVSARGSDINRYSTLSVIRELVRYTLNRADKVMAVSQALKQAMSKLDIANDNISVIPNGVDLIKFRPVSKKEARQSLGLPTDRRVVLSVGHLTRNKGFDLIIRAAKILSSSLGKDNFYLVIVGDGNATTELKNLVSSLDLEQHVLLAGAVPHEELYRWYSAADLFCLASEMEGWPNVLLESLACGTPLVATSVGGVPEIIRSDEIGLLTERDESVIAEAICVALTKSWHSNDLLEHATKNSWERTAWAVRHVFESIVEEIHGVSDGGAPSASSPPALRCKGKEQSPK